MFSRSRLMTPPFSPLEGNFRDMMRTKSTSSTFKESINRGTADPDVLTAVTKSTIKNHVTSPQDTFTFKRLQPLSHRKNSHHISVIVLVFRNCYRDGFIHKDLFLPINIRHCWNLSFRLIISLDGKSFPQI